MEVAAGKQGQWFKQRLEEVGATHQREKNDWGKILSTWKTTNAELEL